MRGAFGYIFLEMGCQVAETLENGHPTIHFRDALPLHGDGGVLEPKLKQEKDRLRVAYACSKCRFETFSPTFREPMTGISLKSNSSVRNMFLTDVISRRHGFRFEAIVNMKAKNGEKEQDIENYLSEFVAALRFAGDHGLYLGKRNAKGLGKVALKDLSLVKITSSDVNKRAEQIEQIVRNTKGRLSLRLISDAISEFPLQGEVIARDAKNASKFFDPAYRQYEDPTIQLANRPIELKTSLSFMDFKQSSGKPRFDASKSAISRGSSFTYRISGASKEFYNALAMAELCRGVGDRTSFGKGEFSIA